MTNPLSGFNQLGANPMFLAGLQILNNNQKGPQYRPAFQGVPNAFAQANQNAFMMQQMQRLGKDQEWQDSERNQIVKEREARAGALGQFRRNANNYQDNVLAGNAAMGDEPADLRAMGAPTPGNPLDPAQITKILMSGDPQMQDMAFQILTSPTQPQQEKLIQVMGPDGVPTLVPQSQAAGRQPVIPGMMPKTKEQMEQAERIARLRAANETTPMSVKEWQYLQSLPPEKQRQFIAMKRSNSPMNLGGQIAQADPLNPGQLLASYPKTLPPQDTPEHATDIAAATETGRAAATLADRAASLPRLEQVANELSALGKDATYTKIGNVTNSLRRQAGMSVGKGATARTAYIAKIDNEVLPLLRETFGAAFTQKEGESLKATLGDPNMSPEEKDAVLQSFIQSKRAQIETSKRRTNSAQPAGSIFDAADAILNRK